MFGISFKKEFVMLRCLLIVSVLVLGLASEASAFGHGRRGACRTTAYYAPVSYCAPVVYAQPACYAQPVVYAQPTVVCQPVVEYVPVIRQHCQETLPPPVSFSGFGQPVLAVRVFGGGY